MMYDEAMAEREAAMAGPQAIVSNHPADGHPLVRRRRNAGGEYEFAAGPPTGGVAYPRKERDFHGSHRHPELLRLQVHRLLRRLSGGVLLPGREDALH